MKTKLCISFIFLILFSLSAPLLISQNPAVKTEINPAPSMQAEMKTLEGKKEAQSPKDAAKNSDDVTWRDILEYTRKANDKTLATTTHIVQAVGVIAGLIALGIGIAGFFTVKKFDSQKKLLNKKLVEANKCLEKIKANQATAEIAINRINDFLNKINQYVQEAQEKSEGLSKIDISSEISNKVQSQLTDFTRKTDFAELLGIQLRPNDYLARGNSFYRKGLFEEALSEISKAIEFKPGYLEAWFNKGVVLRKLNKYPEALAAYEKVIELKPDYPDAWQNKGAILGKLNKYPEALAAYEKVIELKPDCHEAWDNKGVALGILEKYPEALAAFEKAIEMKPDFPNAFYNLACLFSKQVNKTKMLENLKKAIAMDQKFKLMARYDEDFKSYWEDPNFKKLVEDEARAAG